MNCRNCGKEISIKTSNNTKGYIERKNGDVFCSFKCSSSGKFNPAWKGGWMGSSGYKKININGVENYEHRYIMEQNLGRKLLHSEQVHHIDGDKTNNEIENLKLCKNAKEHRREHRNPETYGIFICSYCGKEYKKQKTWVKTEKHFCSRVCAGKAYNPSQKLKFTCPVCDKVFYRKKSALKNTKGKPCCSISCGLTNRHKNKREKS